MPEVLSHFEEPLRWTDGRTFRAQACGASMPDGLWEGWIEFIPVDGGKPVRSPRETTQPNRTDAAYWASGLTPIYLEGALARALRGPAVKRAAPRSDAPIFDRPAAGVGSGKARPVGEAILDPFAVSERGDVALRQKLRALSAAHLVNIIAAYDLSDEPVAALSHLSHETLIDIISAAVSAREG
ncbi:MAG TPA: hypothetical protein VM818_22905 [Vicinamibacterales bacterium]|nr:hypothetical protein [Vicinamibacterales bacterium]